MQEYLYDVPWKKVAVVAPIFLIVLSALLYFFVFAEASEEEVLPEDVQIDLSAGEFNEMKPVITNGLMAAGNFGFNTVRVIETNSFVEVNKIIKDSPDSVDPEMYKSRELAYNEFRDRYVAKGVSAPIDYSISTSVSWPSSLEFGSVTRYFITENVRATKPDYMRKMDLNGVYVDTVKVEVAFDGAIQNGMKTANDTSWDGTYAIMEKAFPDQEATVQLVKIGGEWKIFNITLNDNRFLLSTWENPEEGIYASELNNNGFEEVDRIKTNVELPVQTDSQPAEENKD